MTDKNAMVNPEKNQPITNSDKNGKSDNGKLVAKTLTEANKQLDSEFESNKRKLEENTAKKAKRQADEYMGIMQSVPKKILKELGANIDETLNKDENPEFFRNALTEFIDSIS